jgi:DNA-directed RNA polymerase subunit RPC12/RpoP
MGQKYKGGMWCPYCQKPVLAVKNTHKLRNTLSIMALPATNVLSAGGIKSEGYACPNCGGPAITRRYKQPPNPLVTHVIKPLASKGWAAYKRRRGG